MSCDLRRLQHVTQYSYSNKHAHNDAEYHNDDDDHPRVRLVRDGDLPGQPGPVRDLTSLVCVAPCVCVHGRAWGRDLAVAAHRDAEPGCALVPPPPPRPALPAAARAALLGGLGARAV